MPPPGRNGRPLAFTFDGRTVNGVEGDTLASALHAAGERALMRSIKYHRPRGYFCGVGKCASCLVRVDGVPNARACVTPAVAGMRVETQNAAPSARFDLFSVVDRVYRTKFDYHAKFIRPDFLKPVYHGVIRRMAGFGKLPAPAPLAPRRPPIAKLDADVVVVGGGAAGLAAAAEASHYSGLVTVLDESPLLGGTLRFETAMGNETGSDFADRVKRELGERRGSWRVDAMAVGLYREPPAREPHDPDPSAGASASVGELVVLTPYGLLVAKPRALVVATGSHEVPPLFPANDLPGIMGARAAQILLLRHGVLPGRRVAIVGEGPLADLVAAQLEDAGCEVASRVREEDVERALGGTRVEGLALASGERVACDAVLAATGRAPRVELLQQADCVLEHDARRGGFVPVLTGKSGETTTRGVWAAGSCAGLKTARESVEEGARAGEAAARFAASEKEASR